MFPVSVFPASVFPVSVAAYVVAFVLVIAAAERVRASGALPAALAAHRVVLRRAIRPVAVAVTAVEALLAALLAATLLAEPFPLVLACAAVLFACYGGYAWYVTESGRGGPCGCGGADVPMDHWVTGRAFALAVLAVVAAAASDHVLPLTRFDERLLLVLLAAATISLLLWHLPAAMTRRQEVAR